MGLSLEGLGAAVAAGDCSDSGGALGEGVSHSKLLKDRGSNVLRTSISQDDFFKDKFKRMDLVLDITS